MPNASRSKRGRSNDSKPSTGRSAPRRPTKRDPAHLPPSGAAQRSVGCEWVMCRFESSSSVLEHDGPLGLLVCLTPSGYALPPEVITDDLEGSVWACFTNSLEEAQDVGLPSPCSIRVADEAIARMLERRLASSRLQVVCAETPEVDAVRASFEAYVCQGHASADDAITPLPFVDESAGITAEIVRAFGERALRFRALRPWTYAAGDCLMRIDVPSLDVRDAALSIVYDEGLGGWMVTHIDEEPEEEREAEHPPITDYLALGFVRREVLDESLQAELAEHDLPVDDEDCVPMLFAGNGPSQSRELKVRDYVLAMALLEVLVHFLPRQRELFELGIPREAECVYTVDVAKTQVSVAIAAAHRTFFEEEHLHEIVEDDLDDEIYPA